MSRMHLDLSLSLTGGGHGLYNTGATNLLTFPPQAFNSWPGYNTTVTANAANAPDGSLTADKVIPSAVNDSHGVNDSATLGTGTFTFSVFAKAAGYPRLGMRVYDGAAYQINGTFDLVAGTVVATAAGTLSIQDVGGGWFLCVGTGTSPAGNMGVVTGWCLESLPAGVTVQQGFIGDTTSGAYLWQGQAVAGSDPGPIIYR